MKKLVLSSVIAFIVANFAFASGIPVVDAAANQQMSMQNAKQVAEWAKEASRWSETVAHYQKQLQAYAEELKAKTGIKDSLSTLKDFSQIYADFGRAYENIQDFNEKVLSDPDGFIKDKLKDTYSKYMIFDRCEFIQDTNRRNICLSQMLTTAAEIQSTQEKSKQLNGIAKVIQEIDAKMKQSKDIKESQDLANALSVQTAKLQVINANLQNEHYRYEAERRAREEQVRQIFTENLKNYESNFLETFSGN
ncbi:type IV secretion system protein [Campylobacter helveticus]|uniref:type IV secretion system protein n=1 Tax=Campylobacter helveticus TaxID=28898 RepID=UPI0022EA6D38|nr:type IV secretion system protein [Campylobacter helveticus]